MKAYRDANGEIVYVEEGSFQDLDSIAASLTRVPGLDFNVSADLQNNLDLDGKLDDSQLIDDDTFASATDSNIPSAESVKAYVDSQIASKDEAVEIAYNNASSGLAATNVQTAIDEVEARVDTAETNITANTGNIASNDVDIAELQANQNDLITLTGVAENDTDLGAFTGTTITDNVTIKQALQQLETFAESVNSSIRVTDVDVVADIPARDALSPDEGDVARVLDADGNGNPASFIFDGSVWVPLKTDDLVDSVNGQIGDVILDTDDVAEGVINLYFTEARARAAAVVNSLAGTETDQAPSVAAVNAALEAQDEASEIIYDNSTSGLAATDAQSAIDELDGRLDTIEATAKDYIYANQTIAQTSINGTAVNLVFDNEAIQSAASVFALNTTTGEITVNKTGVFRVDYRLTADTQDGARRTTEALLEINTGSGFAEISASLGSSRAYTYNRNNASGENTAAAQALLSLNSGDVLRVRVRRSNGGGLVQTVPSGTSISIEEK